MKNVYLVRHGESEGNIGSIREGVDSSLTARGREQVGVLAERLKKIPLEVVISSTMGRARETAKIIAEKIIKPIKASDLFVDWRRPTEQIGRPKNDPRAIVAEKTIRANFHLPNFRFSDEENFTDLKSRASQALAFLEKRPEENILVVTHEFFLRALLAYVVFEEGLNGSECEKFIRKFHIKNTGITTLGFDHRGWWVWTWNDHAHLL